MKTLKTVGQFAVIMGLLACILFVVNKPRHQRATDIKGVVLEITATSQQATGPGEIVVERSVTGWFKGHKLPTGSTHELYEDWVMGSPTAVSNELFFGHPPDEYKIYCDGQGHFAPGDSFGVTPFALYVRTNEFEAGVAAWRYKEVVEGAYAKQKASVWTKCSEGL